MSLTDFNDGEPERAIRRRDGQKRVADVLFGAHRWGVITIALTLLLPATIGGAAILFAHDFETTILLFWGLTAVGIGSYFVVARVLAPKVLVQERAWLASLGFELKGYFDALAADPPREGRLLVTLEFQNEPPDAESLAAWLGAVDAQQRGALTFISPRISVRSGTRGTSLTARGFLAWQRRLFNKVLTAVHAAHPLRCVTLSRAHD